MRIYLKFIRESDDTWRMPSVSGYSTYDAARAACQVEIEDEEPGDVHILRDDPADSHTDHILWQAHVTDSYNRSHYSEVTLRIIELDNGRY
jgi:hypothetical protein